MITLSTLATTGSAHSCHKLPIKLGPDPPPSHLNCELPFVGKAYTAAQIRSAGLDADSTRWPPILSRPVTFASLQRDLDALCARADSLDHSNVYSLPSERPSPHFVLVAAIPGLVLIEPASRRVIPGLAFCLALAVRLATWNRPVPELGIFQCDLPPPLYSGPSNITLAHAMLRMPFARQDVVAILDAPEALVTDLRAASLLGASLPIGLVPPVKGALGILGDPAPLDQDMIQDLLSLVGPGLTHAIAIDARIDSSRPLTLAEWIHPAIAANRLADSSSATAHAACAAARLHGSYECGLLPELPALCSIGRVDAEHQVACFAGALLAIDTATCLFLEQPTFAGIMPLKTPMSSPLARLGEALLRSSYDRDQVSTLTGTKCQPSWLAASTRTSFPNCCAPSTPSLAPSLVISTISTRTSTRPAWLPISRLKSRRRPGLRPSVCPRTCLSRCTSCTRYHPDLGH